MTIKSRAGQASSSISFESPDTAGYPDGMGILDQGTRLGPIVDAEWTDLEIFRVGAAREA